jgi:hypothetical protein
MGARSPMAFDHACPDRRKAPGAFTVTHYGMIVVCSEQK